MDVRPILRRSPMVAPALAAAVLAGCGAPGLTERTLGTVENAIHLQVTSSAFDNWKNIPPAYTCAGASISPPISWTGAPPNTRSIALIVTDPDAPGETYVHWVVADLPADTTAVGEDVSPSAPGPAGSTQGTNSNGNVGYAPPCPPSGTHHYQFTVYALNEKVDVSEGITRDALVKEMSGHIIGRGQLVGLVSAS